VLNKVGLLGKALKLKRIWEQVKEPVKIYEEIRPQPDGTAIYIFQARFPTEQDAQLFKQLQQLSSELEGEMQK